MKDNTDGRWSVADIGEKVDEKVDEKVAENFEQWPKGIQPTKRAFK